MTSRVRVARAHLLLTLGVLLLLVFPTTPAQASPADTATADVVFTRIEPLVLTADSTAQIAVRVTNTSSQTMTGSTVTLRAQSWTPSTRSMLIRWLDPDRYTASLYLGSEELPELEPGASTTVTFTVPPEEFAFDTWGPRGIEATVETDAGRAGVTRSWVNWWDESTVTTTSVGVVVPAAQTATEIAAQDTTRVSALEVLNDTPGITVVADPSVIAADTLSAFLPWRNADADALLAGDGDTLTALDDAVATAREETDGVVVVWLDALPEDGTNGVRQADAALVPSDTIEGVDVLTYTPNARMADGEVLMLDSGLTEILAGSASVLDESYSLSSLQQRQLVAAMTAAIARERPSEARTVLAAAPWDVTAEDLQVVDVLSELPWVTPVGLSTVMTGPLNELATIGSAAVSTAGVTASELQQVELARSALDVVQELSDSFTPQVEQWAQQLDTVVSRALRDHPQQRSAIVKSVRDESGTIEHGVSVQRGSDVLMVSSESEMPVTVSNTLEEAVTVQVGLETDDTRLTATDTVVVTLDPGATTTVRIPVRAAAAADLEVRVLLTTASGQPVGSPDTLQVRIRPDWENWMVWGSVGFGVLVLALGIVKTVQRNKASGRAQEIGKAAVELDELALKRAAQADRREGRV